MALTVDFLGSCPRVTFRFDFFPVCRIVETCRRWYLRFRCLPLLINSTALPCKVDKLLLSTIACPTSHRCTGLPRKTANTTQRATSSEMSLIRMIRPRASCPGLQTRLTTIRVESRRTTGASSMRDVVWSTWTLPFGWPARGVWPTTGNDPGTDVTCTQRSGSSSLLGAGDNFGYEIKSEDTNRREVVSGCCNKPEPFSSQKGNRCSNGR